MLKKVVSFKLAQLKTLVESEDSCVALVPSCERTITLSPIHLNNIKESVREILESKITKYDFELNGIILSHKHVKIMDSMPLDDGGKFKLKMLADIYLFKPSIGSVLKGVVNKKSRDHLGCLVHSIFNVAIPRPAQMDSCKPWVGSRLAIGQDISFKVVFMDFCGRLPYIRGELIENGLCFEDSEEIDSGIGCQESMEEDGVHEYNSKKKKKKDKHKLENGGQEINSSHEESYQEHTPKKKCKKRKASLMDDMENIPSKRLKESNYNDDSYGSEEYNKSLCRKKKKRESLNSDWEASRVSEDHIEVPAKEHKKKKRKRSLTEDFSEPLLKKSRKESLGTDSTHETSLNHLESSKKKKRKSSTTEDLISSLLHETEIRLTSPPPYRSLNSSLRKSKLQGSIESITSELLKDALATSSTEGNSSSAKKKKESLDRSYDPFITSTPQTDSLFKLPNHSGLDTSVLNDSTETTLKKKKKRSSAIDLDSPNPHSLSNSESRSLTLYDFTTPKHKKKKKRKSFSEDLESMTASLLAKAVKELK